MKDNFLRKSNQKKHNDGTELLPYWGLKSAADSDRAAPGLQGQSICVVGLTRSDFSELKRLTRHTGLELYPGEKNGLPHFFVEVKKNTTSPLKVKDLETTYHLKPLREQTKDVQTWVHKHLWLPSNAEPFTLTFHSSEEINIPEWLCYLLIQYFMQPRFQPLSRLSYEEYEQAVTSILEPLNPALAARQLSVGRGSQEDWPATPPEQETAKTFDPFKSNRDPEHAEPINPFQNQKKSEKPTTFNPFRKE